MINHPSITTSVVLPASRLVPRQITFLWPGRLPCGKLAIFDGDPGLGKSLVALDLCARLSAGRPFPDGTTCPGPANSVILNAEDTAEDTILPRLRALDADLDRIFVTTSDDDTLPLRFPSCIAAFDDILAKTQAKLVVIDPIVSFLDTNVLLASDLSVRKALQALALLANKYQCVIVLIRHLNKTGGRRAIYRGGGSIGFLAACRTAWLIAEDPKKPTLRVLAQIKNNVAQRQPSLAFEVVATNAQTPILSWSPGPHSLTSDQLLAGAAKPPPPSNALDRACDFLMAILQDGPRTSREIWTAAEEAQLSERTLFRAKKDLNITTKQIRADHVQTSYWLLPGQEMPNSVTPETIVPDLEQWLAPIREKYPPPTPLDNM